MVSQRERKNMQDQVVQEQMRLIDISERKINKHNHQVELVALNSLKGTYWLSKAQNKIGSRLLASKSQVQANKYKELLDKKALDLEQSNAKAQNIIHVLKIKQEQSVLVTSKKKKQEKLERDLKEAEEKRREKCDYLFGFDFQKNIDRIDGFIRDRKN